jgi:hypothetical protein
MATLTEGEVLSRLCFSILTTNDKWYSLGISHVLTYGSALSDLFRSKRGALQYNRKPPVFLPVPIHAMALGKTELTVDAKKGLTIVFGDTGYGKSPWQGCYMESSRTRGMFPSLLPTPIIRPPTVYCERSFRSSSYQKPQKHSKRTWIYLRNTYISRRSSATKRSC